MHIILGTFQIRLCSDIQDLKGPKNSNSIRNPKILQNPKILENIHLSGKYKNIYPKSDLNTQNTETLSDTQIIFIEMEFIPKIIAENQNPILQKYL